MDEVVDVLGIPRTLRERRVMPRPRRFHPVMQRMVRVAVLFLRVLNIHLVKVGALP